MKYILFKDLISLIVDIMEKYGTSETKASVCVLQNLYMYKIRDDKYIMYYVDDDILRGLVINYHIQDGTDNAAFIHYYPYECTLDIVTNFLPLKKEKWKDVMIVPIVQVKRCSYEKELKRIADLDNDSNRR